MACIHCALVQGYLPVLVIPAPLGRHLAIRLLLNNYWTGTCLGGYCTGELFGLVSMWYGRTWEAHITSKHIFNWYSFRRYSFVKLWNSFKPWVAGLLLLSTVSNLALEDSNFVLTKLLPIYSRVIDINNFCLYWFGVWVVGTLNVHLAWSQVWDFFPTICC